MLSPYWWRSKSEPADKTFKKWGWNNPKFLGRLKLKEAWALNELEDYGIKNGVNMEVTIRSEKKFYSTSRSKDYWKY